MSDFDGIDQDDTLLSPPLSLFVRPSWASVFVTSKSRVYFSAADCGDQGLCLLGSEHDTFGVEDASDTTRVIAHERFFCPLDLRGTFYSRLYREKKTGWEEGMLNKLH